MGGSIGSQESGSDAFGSFNQNVWGGQAPALQNLYNQANYMFNQTAGGALNQAPWAQNYSNYIANQTAPEYLNQLGGGAYQGIGGADVYGNILQSLNSPSNMQQQYQDIMGGTGGLPLAKAVQGNMVQNASDVMDRSLSALDARAAGSGMSGSSRHGLAQADTIQNINQNLQSDLANLGYQAYEPNLQRQLDIANQADQGNIQRQQMLMSGLEGQQQAQQGALGISQLMQQLGSGGFDAYNQAWGPLGMLASAIGGPQVLSSGNMASNSDSSSKGLGFGM